MRPRTFLSPLPLALLWTACGGVLPPISVPPISAAEPAAAAVPAIDAVAHPSFPLFDGETLDGWVVTDCKVAVEEGRLAALEGNGLVRTEETYEDFVLELDWKPRLETKYDSGIYIRSALPKPGKPFPDRWQINLKQGDAGNLLGKTKIDTSPLLKPNDWNTFRITAIGGTVALEINGKPAWKIDNMETPSGYLGLQVEVPGGGQFDFRNIRLTDLGRKSWFDGKTLAGWEPVKVGGKNQDGDCWQVADGSLHCTGKAGPRWLRSTEQVSDFSLRLQYKIAPGGNSGVYVRVPADGNHHGPGAGAEVQILDDAAPKYANLRPDQFAGSLYSVRGASERVGRPAGRWNNLEVTCAGKIWTVIHNGTPVVTVDADKVPAMKDRLTQGFLGFQNHGGQVWYRNIRVGAVPAAR